MENSIFNQTQQTQEEALGPVLEQPTQNTNEFLKSPFPQMDVREGNVDPINEGNKSSDYGLTDAFVDGMKANAFGIGRINHPAGTRVDPDFDLRTKEKELSELPQEVRDSVLGYNPTNESDYQASILRASDEVEWQKNIYDNYGIAGSLGFNVVGGIVQPDVLLALPLRAVTVPARAAFMTSTIMNVLSKSRTARVVGKGAEYGTYGVGIEALRQETSGVSFEDDLYAVGLFGMVLGAGGKAASEFITSAPRPDRIIKAIETDADVTKQSIKPLSSGPMDMKKFKFSEVSLTPEDVSFVPTSGVFGKLNVMSPRGYLYGVQSPKLRNLLQWLAPSKLPLFNKDGSVHVQGARSAEDITDTTYKGMYNDLKAYTREAYSEYKSKTENPLDEYEFFKEVYRQRIEVNKPLREHQAGLEYYEGKIETLNTKIEKLKAKVEAVTKDGKTPSANTTNTLAETETALTKFITTYDGFKANKPIEYAIKDPYMAKANKQWDDYYSKMDYNRQYWLKDKTPEEINIAGSKRYTTRLWDKEAITAMPKDKVVSTIRNAIINSPTGKFLKANDSKAYEGWVKSADVNSEKFLEKIYQAESYNDIMDYLPTGSMISSKRSLERKLDVDENMLNGLVRSNLDDVTELYHRDLAGKMALKEAVGVTTKGDLEIELKSITNELYALGYDTKKVQKITDNLNVVLDSLLGKRSIAKNPNSTGNTFKRYTTKWNNITLGMGFGYTSLMEIGPVLALTGVKGLKYLIPSVQNTIRKYRGKETDVAIHNQLKAMGIGMDVYNSRIASRFSDDTINFADSKADKFLEKQQLRVMHGSGLIGITDAFKDMAGMSYIHRLHDLGRKINSGEKLTDLVPASEMSRFARHGLTETDLRNFGKQDVKYSDKGLLEDLNWDTWDISLKDKLSVAVDRAVKGNVLEPSSLDLPAAMTDPNGLFAPLMLQYMRFPIAATESYLLRGLAEKDKGALIGGMISIAVLGTLETGKDALLQASGITTTPMYDLETEEGKAKLAWKLFNYNPYAGVLPTVANFGFGLVGEPQPGSTYTPRDVIGTVAGPTYSRLGGAVDVLKNQYSDPGTFGKTEAYQLKLNTPFLGSVPIFKDLWSNYIKEEF